MMIKEIYQQLRLSLQLGGMITRDIYKCSAQCKNSITIKKIGKNVNNKLIKTVELIFTNNFIVVYL